MYYIESITDYNQQECESDHSLGRYVEAITNYRVKCDMFRPYVAIIMDINMGTSISCLVSKISTLDSMILQYHLKIPQIP